MPLFDDTAPDTTEHINLFLMGGDQPTAQGELVPKENILVHLMVPLRECSPVLHPHQQGDYRWSEVVGWSIPYAQGEVMHAGLASWMRVVLPGAAIVDCSLADIGMGTKPLVIYPGVWWQLWNLTVRYPPQQVIRLETKQ